MGGHEGKGRRTLFLRSLGEKEAGNFSDVSNPDYQSWAPTCTVEPPNKGHFGSGYFVLYLEAVLWWEVRITIVGTRVIPIGAIASVLYIEVVLWWEGPL